MKDAQNWCDSTPELTVLRSAFPHIIFYIPYRYEVQKIHAPQGTQPLHKGQTGRLHQITPGLNGYDPTTTRSPRLQSEAILPTELMFAPKENCIQILQASQAQIEGPQAHAKYIVDPAIFLLHTPFLILWIINISTEYSFQLNATERNNSAPTAKWSDISY